jgi:hypothetical protein
MWDKHIAVIIITTTTTTTTTTTIIIIIIIIIIIMIIIIIIIIIIVVVVFINFVELRPFPANPKLVFVPPLSFNHLRPLCRQRDVFVVSI